MSWTRRYSSDPGLAELAKIEGVVIIDNDPPPSPTGGLTGFVTAIAELEDGPFNVPTQLLNGTDFQNTFGGFGFTYDGVASNNPCARARKADGALNPEYWNGNGFIALANKRFRQLAVVRVDTSVGSVQFTRRAAILGNNKAQWSLTAAQQLTLDIGGGPLNAIFNAGIAIKTSSAQTFPNGFTGGEKMTIVADEGTPNQIGPFEVTFLAGDTTQSAIISRINLAAGYTMAAASSGTVTTLSGRQKGTGGNVRIVSQDATVTTALAWALTAVVGTGNVSNIDQVTFAEVKSIVEAAVAGTTVERTPSGLLRIAANSAGTITATTATTADDFGFTEAVASTAATGNAGTIPAGTRVRTGGGVEWVTCQTIAVTAANAGPYSVKVRPAVDDGTTGSASASSVTVMPAALELAAFSVTNSASLSAALTEAAIDAAYLAAFATTLTPNKVTAKSDLFISARASNAIRQAARTNAIEASNNGLVGRKFIMRPPLGSTTRALAISSNQPGAGAYRSDRVIYAFPGTYIFLPQIAVRGLAGGAGFSADGYIDVGFDSFVASICSQVNPEENPGQLTTYATAALGIERNNADVQSMEIDDYVAFKAAGIAALYMEDGTATIQSGVVNVDPAQFDNLKNIARRRMADYIQDSLAVVLKPFAKKLGTKDRRATCLGTVDEFLLGLAGTGASTAQRIDSYSVDGRTGNTPEALAKGIFRIKVRVKTFSSLDVIVLDCTIGETVTIAEAA